MTYSVKHARSGLTAIAAVLALSSTSLAAQEVADPLAPAAETTSTPTPEAAPQPEATTSEPVADTSAPEPTAAETAMPSTTSRQTATRSRATTTARRVASEPAAAAAPIAAPATEAPAEGMPVPPPPVGATVDPGAMPVDETATAETSAMPSDETLSIVGAAGLGLFALGGIGMAIGRRRKRKEEEAHMAANRAYLESHPVADKPTSHSPAFARTAPAMAVAGPGPVRTDVPRTKLPEGFDLSRFGPHTRAAYLGPTEDNPSLSMKHRLRRAAAMDQQARIHGEAPQETVKAAAARPDRATMPMWNVGNDGFMLRRAPGKQAQKPAFQH
ncbi:hypothetical protein LZ496_08815 [Sphingomonas sp. NSE70-1]|uniref:LPXTG-motif cell wall anchor domain-containing protein n=1 Tax=Sphingomonas caseinilyticus TaxID=2908205 RepID=A0ABT0RVF3_9SPHN|nr:hypothetical protein [Sphingomonas caseinilyticus]MCL6698879.1 hypothetical protein [Sphingomonas caseinilyticus]